MTDDTIHPDDVEDRSDAHQQAVEACRHAVDALPGDGLPRAGRSSIKRGRPPSAPNTTTPKPNSSMRPSMTATGNFYKIHRTDIPFEATSHR
jgi:hypothetical protein